MCFLPELFIYVVLWYLVSKSFNSDNIKSTSGSVRYANTQNEMNTRTIKELSRPVKYKPICSEYPYIGRSNVLRDGLIDSDSLNAEIDTILNMNYNEIRDNIDNLISLVEEMLRKNSCVSNDEIRCLAIKLIENEMHKKFPFSKVTDVDTTILATNITSYDKTRSRRYSTQEVVFPFKDKEDEVRIRKMLDEKTPNESQIKDDYYTNKNEKCFKGGVGDYDGIIYG